MKRSYTAFETSAEPAIFRGTRWFSVVFPFVYGFIFKTSFLYVVMSIIVVLIPLRSKTIPGR